MDYFPWLCEITRGYPPENLNQDNYEVPVIFQHHLRCIFHIWANQFQSCCGNSRRFGKSLDDHGFIRNKRHRFRCSHLFDQVTLAVEITVPKRGRPCFPSLRVPGRQAAGCPSSRKNDCGRAPKECHKMPCWLLMMFAYNSRNLSWFTLFHFFKFFKLLMYFGVLVRNSSWAGMIHKLSSSIEWKRRWQMPWKKIGRECPCHVYLSDRLDSTFGAMVQH